MARGSTKLSGAFLKGRKGPSKKGGKMEKLHDRMPKMSLPKSLRGSRHKAKGA